MAGFREPVHSAKTQKASSLTAQRGPSVARDALLRVQAPFALRVESSGRKYRVRLGGLCFHQGRKRRCLHEAFVRAIQAQYPDQVKAATSEISGYRVFPDKRTVSGQGWPLPSAHGCVYSVSAFRTDPISRAPQPAATCALCGPFMARDALLRGQAPLALHSESPAGSLKDRLANR